MHQSSILGRSKSIRTLREEITRAAQAPYPVLVTGESGTGKELVARALHAQSPRSSGPFIALCCGTISRTLTESVLFGHARGAFTGAEQNTRGLFQAAHKGTIFLDEVDTMTPEMQACLLRAVETGEVRRVGSTNSSSANVRIISATNAECLIQQEFRNDLYYRLSVISIHVPPLRERKEDIALLVQHFLHQVANETGTAVRGIARDALQLLQTYPWPGNVRELQSAIRQACMLSSGAMLTARDFAFVWRSKKPNLPSLKEYASTAIRQFGGTVPWKDLSAALGISRKTLWAWRKEIPRNGNHTQRQPLQ